MANQWVKRTLPLLLLTLCIVPLASAQQTGSLSGKVTAVDVFKSSGSNEIDQPCLIAMYDWWFEPLRDKAGRPVPDTILFTINFR